MARRASLRERITRLECAEMPFLPPAEIGKSWKAVLAYFGVSVGPIVALIAVATAVH